MIRLLPWQLEEITKSTLAPRYFIENYCWLEREATAEVLPFILLLFQIKILASLQKGEKIIVLKSRRVGWSWILAAFTAWLINFHKGVKVLLLSRTEDEAIAVLDKVKFILNNLRHHDSGDFNEATPASWLRGTIIASNKSQLTRGYYDEFGVLTSKSTVVSLTNTDQSGRGKGATYLFLDEFAFYEHDWVTWRAISKTIIGGGTWAIGSSANGVGNKFHQLVSQSQLGENIDKNGDALWKYLEVHWSESWLTKEMVDADKAASDADDAAQEWEMKFLSSGNAVFDPTHLANCYKPLDEYPELVEELEKYREQVGDGTIMYYSGADTMQGKVHKKSSKKDWHSFTALTDSGIQAGNYSSQESLNSWSGYEVDDPASGDIVKIPGTLSGLHKDFPGILKIEEQGGGSVAYDNHVLPDDFYSEVEKFQQTQKTKWGGVKRMQIAIETHQIIITELKTYQQMQTYQDNGPGANRYSAPAGFNDDEVLSLIIAHENMLKHGGREFSWGADATMLKRGSETGKINTTRMDVTQMYGPMAQVPELDFSKRMTDEINGPGRLQVPKITMPVPDFDLMQEMGVSGVEPYDNMPTRRVRKSA